ncbi:MAG: TonB-dependent receptor plug domain-containing protein [Ignavibacteria bacterium]|nr:TonB-dependent receptor plug domain-containing protein [Ignavibacteria bacterium]
MIKYLRGFIIILALLIINNLYPQTKDTSKNITFDIYKIKTTRTLALNSDTISIKDFIWNDRRNLGEILNERNGYIINYFSYGGRNTINYNSYSENSIGIFKDGIQQNDIIFGGYDIENISVNEIEKIEEVSSVLSFLYGTNSRGKAINIISKDIFLPYIFTQLRYTQDRYGALGADVNLTIPFSKKINYTFGVSSNVTDGRYQNNHLNIWRARSRINYFSNEKFNLKIDFNYSRIVRGLFGGLYNSTDDTLSSYILARIKNAEAYEKILHYYFNFGIKAKLLKDEAHLTELNLYTINSLREYNDLENSPTPNNILIYNAYKFIRYGINIRQKLDFALSKSTNINLLIGGDLYFDLYHYNKINPDTSIKYDPALNLNIMTMNHYSFYSRADIDLKSFYLTSGIREDYFEDKFHLQYGIEGGIKINLGAEKTVTFFGGINSTKQGLNYNKIKYLSGFENEPYYLDNDRTYMEFGIKYTSEFIKIHLKQFASDYAGNIDFLNGNYSFEYCSKYFDSKINIDKFKFDNYPDVFIKADLCYHNFFFDKRLNLRAGLLIKFASKYKILYYSQYKYEFLSDTLYNNRDFFNIDLYIGARIGSANVTFTFANLLNHLNYTTSIFPYDDRGGLFNSLARFSIVWDFKY